MKLTQIEKEVNKYKSYCKKQGISPCSSESLSKYYAERNK